MIIYRIFYFMMIIGYTFISLNTPDLRMKIAGALLTGANAVIFWR